MEKVSIIITGRNEVYLPRMVQDLLEKLTGDYEILIAQDGAPYHEIPSHPKVKVFNREYQGLKPQINFLAAAAVGTYLFKLDAHCMVSHGIDEEMQRMCGPYDIVTPRFYVLNAEEWKWQDDRFYDYFFLGCPLTDPGGYRFKAGGHDRRRTIQLLNGPDIDETMQIHGSAWFIRREHFLFGLGGMQSEGYGNMFMEPPELCLKTWLGPWGGRVLTNKNAWYAHMHKGGQRPRGYDISMREVRRSYLWTADYWMQNQWAERIHDIEWLVDKFWPVPTWPDNWRELEHERRRNA